MSERFKMWDWFTEEEKRRALADTYAPIRPDNLNRYPCPRNASRGCPAGVAMGMPDYTPEEHEVTNYLVARDRGPSEFIYEETCYFIDSWDGGDVGSLAAAMGMEADGE